MSYLTGGLGKASAGAYISEGLKLTAFEVAFFGFLDCKVNLVMCFATRTKKQI